MSNPAEIDAFHQALNAGNVDKAREWIEKGIDVNAFYYAMHTLNVRYLPDKPVFELVKLLVDNGGDFNRGYQYGESGFFTAVADGHLEAAEYMLDKNPDLTVKLQNGATSLHCLGEKGEGRPMQVSLTLKKDGEAITLTDPGAIRKIHGSDPDDEYFRYVRTFEVLLEHGMDVHAVDSDGFTPIFTATRSGATEMVALLLAHGARPTVKDHWQVTPLHYAVRKGFSDIVDLLVTAGADVNPRDNYGFTPLHETAEENRPRIAQFLLDHGAERHPELVKHWEKYKKGDTPLTIAEQNGFEDVVRVLKQ